MSGKTVVAAVAALVVVMVGIQLVPVKRSNPPVKQEMAAPPAVSKILHGACYDCHSSLTRWPWYSHVAPTSWLLAEHVKDGRKALDFTDWPVLNFDAQDDLLRHIAKQVGEGNMPPLSYRLIHPEARLTDEERAAIVKWTEGP